MKKVLFLTVIFCVCFSLGTFGIEKTESSQTVQVPLVDHPEQLKSLDPTAPIWVNTERTQVILGGQICLREGLLEFFACRQRSKEHESIISLPIKPHLIHAALLVIGAQAGKPARFDPVFVPPTGEKIDIRVRWLDSKGKRQERRAQDMIREAGANRIMSAHWVFTGGLFGTDSKGKKYYLADLSGEIFGLANFPGSILDVPFESSSNNNELYYQPNTENIPEVGTSVTLILTREK